MHHIENDIADIIDQLQPDNQQAEQIAQETLISELFTRLKPQDVEQFYQSYQLWKATSRIQAIQVEIEQVQQEMASNAGLMEQYRPSPIAQSTLAQLQAHDVGDINLLDQMLERGDNWLDHTMQLLEQCEHLDIIHGNYTEWCTHALEGAYDWIGSMHETESADVPVETPASSSDEVFDESTEQLLLQKLLSDEEEMARPLEAAEPTDQDGTIEETPTEGAPVEDITPQEDLQATETPEDAIPAEDEPEVLTAPSDDEESVMTDLAATNSEPSAIIELPDTKDSQSNASDEVIQQTSSTAEAANDPETSAVLATEVTEATDTIDEIDESTVEIQPDTIDNTIDKVADDQTIIEAETLEDAATEVSPTIDQDATDEIEPEELSGEEIEQPEVFTVSNEDTTPNEQDEVTEDDAEPDEQETPGEVQPETINISTAEDTSSNEEDIVEPAATVATSATDDAESDSQASVPPITINEPVIPLSADPELVELQDREAEVEILPVQAQEDAIIADEAELMRPPSAQESNEDTIAIPKITFLISRVTPLHAITDDTDDQPTLSIAALGKTPRDSIQETPPPIETNTIPNLPAMTITSQATAPSSTAPLPDIYGETNKQPAIPQTPAPIWQESANSLQPQISSSLLPEPQQGFFQRLWLRFLAWLRGQ